MIKGGYYIKARKIQESEIAHKPPHVREIWDWLLKEANHQEKTSNGTIIKRGQCVRTYDDIREGLHWMVGWRKMRYTKWDCEKAMKVLKKATMITTKKTTRGLFITICNYETYQNPKNYESHNHVPPTKATRKPQTADTINKNEKNVKNEKKRTHFITWLDYKKEIKKPITNKRTLDSLVRRFNTETIERIEWVVNYSIENNYQGLFWDKYKEGTVPPKPQKKINHYVYQCTACEKKFYPREMKGDDDAFPYRCDQNACQTVGLGKDGKNMVGVQLKYIKRVLKES